MKLLNMHHVGVAVPDLNQAIPVYEKLFGYKVLSGPFEDRVQSVSVAFVGTGQDDKTLIELVEPLDERSPINQYLRKGIGAYHVCYQTDEIFDALDYVKSNACLVISRPQPAVAFGGRKIAWIYTPTKQLIELLES